MMRRSFIMTVFNGVMTCLILVTFSAQATYGDAEVKMGSTQNQVKQEFSQEERTRLLQLARDTLTLHFEKGKTPDIKEDALPAKFREERGCFVTLMKGKDHSLRGCIGNIQPHKKLYQAVIDNALSAALKDWRFRPVTAQELADITIEVSILTVPGKIEFGSPEELLATLRPGIDGIYLFFGRHSSTFLPQVWEKLPDKKEFLTNLCVKGGAPDDCWKRKEVEIYTYQAEYFHETDR